MTKWRGIVKWGDAAVIGATLLLCVLLWANLWTGYDTDRTIGEVVVRGETVLRYRLATAQKVYEHPDIEQYLDQYLEEQLTEHELLVHLESQGIHFDLLIKDGKIRFALSDCPDRVCVYTGFIHKSGQLAACVPANVLVRISGKADPDDPDFIAG